MKIIKYLEIIVIFCLLSSCKNYYDLIDERGADPSNINKKDSYIKEEKSSDISYLFKDELIKEDKELEKYSKNNVDVANEDGSEKKSADDNNLPNYSSQNKQYIEESPQTNIPQNAPNIVNNNLGQNSNPNYLTSNNAYTPNNLPPPSPHHHLTPPPPVGISNNPVASDNIFYYAEAKDINPIDAIRDAKKMLNKNILNDIRVVKELVGDVAKMQEAVNNNITPIIDKDYKVVKNTKIPDGYSVLIAIEKQKILANSHSKLGGIMKQIDGLKKDALNSHIIIKGQKYEQIVNLSEEAKVHIFILASLDDNFRNKHMSSILSNLKNYTIERDNSLNGLTTYLKYDNKSGTTNSVVKEIIASLQKSNVPIEQSISNSKNLLVMDIKAKSYIKTDAKKKQYTARLNIEITGFDSQNNQLTSDVFDIEGVAKKNKQEAFKSALTKFGEELSKKSLIRYVVEVK